MNSGDEKTKDDGQQAETVENGALDNRLEELDAKLDKYRQQEKVQNRVEQGNGANSSGLAMAWRLGSEFISGVLVGGLIGYAIDKWFGTEPWGLIIFILLGFLAGMLNMLRSAGKISPPGGE